MSQPSRDVVIRRAKKFEGKIPHLNLQYASEYASAQLRELSQNTWCNMLFTEYLVVISLYVYLTIICVSVNVEGDLFHFDSIVHTVC